MLDYYWMFFPSLFYAAKEQKTNSSCVFRYACAARVRCVDLQTIKYWCEQITCEWATGFVHAFSFLLSRRNAWLIRTAKRCEGITLPPLPTSLRTIDWGANGSTEKLAPLPPSPVGTFRCVTLLFVYWIAMIGIRHHLLDLVDWAE